MTPGQPDIPVPALDRKRLAAVSGGDTEFERELVEAFIDDACAHASSIAKAIASGDAEKIQGEAHALKGSARNVGAPAVAAVAVAIEVACAGGGVDPEFCARLTDEIARLRSEAAS